MTKNKKGSGIIYIVTNNKTDKVVYVGITTKSLSSRKKDHEQRAKRGKTNLFQETIATLGAENFKWVTDNTLYENDELAQKEQELIENYKKQGVRLLNEDRGGGIQKTVYRYNVKDGGLLAKYTSLEEASNSVNSTKQQISRACINKTQYKNHYWSYRLQVPFQPKKDNRLKEVIQCCPYSGKTINIFKSIAEASRVTEVNKNSIAKCCRGERKLAGDYFWKYK
ncbi:NUMOD1 domain-containing DNA-binding protein [Tenacibaculum mesophilum]|uniref:NUMOD1 domain-containing DNA-binding protein n=1 Tax=Tenacibaculum mesophilum TaxID=104268 RepID=UPI003F60BF81